MIVALAATVVMAASEFDLSVGALASLGGVVAAQLAVRGVPVPLCFLIASLAGLGVGLVSGLLITRFRLLSFITTLAMGTVLGGLTFWLTGGSTVFENIPANFSALGRASLLGIPALSLVMLAVVLGFWFVLTHTPFGRRLYAVGGNESAARVAGINAARPRRWPSRSQGCWRPLPERCWPPGWARRSPPAATACFCPPTRRPFWA